MLISFRNFLAVPETLKSLLQHHSSKASILQLSAFFMVQLSHPYMTTGKTDYANLCRQSDLSSVDYEGYYISSKGFLSTVVDIMVI